MLLLKGRSRILRWSCARGIGGQNLRTTRFLCWRKSSVDIPVSKKDGLRPHPSNWTEAPEKANTHCLYCKQPVPNHSQECVVPHRTVVVELTTRMVISMPRCFTRTDINFSMNGSSACMGRYIDQLYAETNSEEGICKICHRTKMKYLREASQQDHEDLHYGEKRKRAKK